jgi:hypothetical protein
MSTAYSKCSPYCKNEHCPVSFYRRELPGLGDPSRSRNGWICGGLCPFHDDRSKGSFRINILSGSFVCYSCGASGGDVVDFARLRYGLDFQQAVDYCRAMTGGV